ncbi:MAG: hypothetical protein V3U88_05515 [Methylococcales bacterium]
MTNIELEIKKRVDFELEFDVSEFLKKVLEIIDRAARLRKPPLVYLGGCPRIEAYCGKTDFGPLFRLNSFNTASIRLI